MKSGIQKTRWPINICTFPARVEAMLMRTSVLGSIRLLLDPVLNINHNNNLIHERWKKMKKKKWKRYKNWILFTQILISVYCWFFSFHSPTYRFVCRERSRRVVRTWCASDLCNKLVESFSVTRVFLLRHELDGLLELHVVDLPLRLALHLGENQIARRRGELEKSKGRGKGAGECKKKKRKKK